jgi:hypothetical protein
MSPPIPRRELARRLAAVPSVGTRWGLRGRRARTYPLTAIMTAHAEWVRSNVGHLPTADPSCQNAVGQESA